MITATYFDWDIVKESTKKHSSSKVKSYMSSLSSLEYEAWHVNIVSTKTQHVHADIDDIFAVRIIEVARYFPMLGPTILVISLLSLSLFIIQLITGIVAVHMYLLIMILIATIGLGVVMLLTVGSTHNGKKQK